MVGHVCLVVVAVEAVLAPTPRLALAMASGIQGASVWSDRHMEAGSRPWVGCALDAIEGHDEIRDLHFAGLMRSEGVGVATLVLK